MSESVSADSLLSIQNITKRFDGFTAVDNVSFDLPQGAIGGLIGPNGAGKTTLFNTLAGLLKPDSGALYLNRTPIHELSPDKIFAQGLARTFQIPRPFPEMTVLENLMMVPQAQCGERFWNNWIRPRQVAREEREIRNRAAELIDYCGLSAVKTDKAGTLSGGQLKLLELARVLMSNPQIILLDEPAAGVNPTLMHSLIDRIVALNERGYTFLLIEHNMEVVMSICDPVMVMAQGQLIYKGDAAGARANDQVLDAYLGGLP